MSNPCAAADREPGRHRGEPFPGTPGGRQAFVALRVMPGGGSVPPDTLEAVSQKIPGVAALRLDAARGRIHVLYDGAASTLEQVEREVSSLGLIICHRDEDPATVSGPPGEERSR